MKTQPKAAGQPDPERMAKLRKDAIPVTEQTGFVTDFENNCVLATARHPLHLHETVIRIPVSLLLMAAASVVMTTVGPLLIGLERGTGAPAPKVE